MPMVTIMRAERPASSRFGKPRFLYSHRKARPEDVLEKALEQGGHRSMPKRKQKDPVLCSAHVLPGLLQARWQRPGLEIPLRPQQRELKLGHFYPPYLVFRCRGGGVSVSHGVQEVVPGRARMALDNRNVPRHLLRSVKSPRMPLNVC